MDPRLRALVITSGIVEYNAVCYHVGDLWEVTTSKGTIYDRGTFEENWDVTIAQIDLIDGRVAAEISESIDYVQPNLIIFVGTATGINGARYGDIVFANKIYLLESSDSGDFSPKEIMSIPYRLQQRAKHQARKGNWIERTIQFSSYYTHRSYVFIGSILFGKERDLKLSSQYKGFRAIEFDVPAEYYSHESDNIAIVKGIYNSQENHDIEEDNIAIKQYYAAGYASAFAFEFLSKVDLATLSPENPTDPPPLPSPKKNKARNLVVSKITLSNIKCFRKLEVDLKEGENFHGWTTILGDNAVGKSTLLRSIVLGLCNEGDAVALIKEMSGDLIREGEDRGCITIHLIEDKKTRGKKYTITTTIEKTDNKTEIVRQTTDPVENFPWDDIFVCGYGAYRSQRADISYKEYKTIDAVRSLFNQQTTLQNPEIILLRQEPEIRQILEEKLKNILMLDIPEYGLQYSKRGLEIVGSWGRMPLESLSDGYRSTATWVLDFIGWLIYAERLVSNPDIGGILIVDELEQHLHPRWQRYIVSRLRQQFPKTQIIVTTHTPLVAAGIADVDRGMLLKLKRDDLLGEIVIQRIDLETIAGKPADRVLTSEAFDLLTTRNDRSHDDVDRYTQLLGKKQRTDDEEAELQRLKPIIKDRFNNGETTAAQIAEEAIDVALQK
jgi:hypothetical protein